jgi:hypothetical protein
MACFLMLFWLVSADHVLCVTRLAVPGEFVPKYSWNSDF